MAQTVNWMARAKAAMDFDGEVQTNLLPEPAPWPTVFDGTEPERELRPYIRMQGDYMSDVLGDLDKLLDEAADHLRDVDFDTVVGIGLSGALFIPELARRLGKRFMILRKPGEKSHSYSEAEGTLGRRWVFVDDLVDSGSTWKTVQQRVAAIADAHDDFETEWVGDYLYLYGGQFNEPRSAWYHPMARMSAWLDEDAPVELAEAAVLERKLSGAPRRELQETNLVDFLQEALKTAG